MFNIEYKCPHCKKMIDFEDLSNIELLSEKNDVLYGWCKHCGDIHLVQINLSVKPLRSETYNISLSELIEFFKSDICDFPPNWTDCRTGQIIFNKDVDEELQSLVIKYLDNKEEPKADFINAQDYIKKHTGQI